MNTFKRDLNFLRDDAIDSIDWYHWASNAEEK
jgi:hypothetical protein